MIKKCISIEPKYKIAVRHIYDTETRIEYREIICNEHFIDVGVVPTPRNKKEQFIHDICHGVLMRYSLLSIIDYSLRNFFDKWQGWEPKT